MESMLELSTPYGKKVLLDPFDISVIREITTLGGFDFTEIVMKNGREVRVKESASEIREKQLYETRKAAMTRRKR